MAEKGAALAALHPITVLALGEELGEELDLCRRTGKPTSDDLDAPDAEGGATEAGFSEEEAIAKHSELLRRCGPQGSTSAGDERQWRVVGSGWHRRDTGGGARCVAEQRLWTPRGAGPNQMTTGVTIN